MIADFNATNGQGITVVGEQIPWDGGGYSNTVFTAAMGGGGPDVASWKLTATPSFVANDLLAPLDEYLSGWDGYGEIEESLWNVMKEAGRRRSGIRHALEHPGSVRVLSSLPVRGGGRQRAHHLSGIPRRLRGPHRQRRVRLRHARRQGRAGALGQLRLRARRHLRGPHHPRSRAGHAGLHRPVPKGLHAAHRPHRRLQPDSSTTSKAG